ncbi:DUF4974 domain-containing protein [Pedobacter psychrodurus]|uniref:DUF4974 domain-containing protein n=1 Tax=Pedobacter psychrodurus TaxID=2530456 RepID=A0A4R0Q036_9SPHI|nr:FecR domain-containing protein [Pedobacter psychrodurus]TCD25460.1 DUF4974 domain-containing protein [Pedobacter psychrodurus]
MQRKNIKSVLEKISSGDFTADEEIISKYWIHQLNPKIASGYSDDELERVSNEMWIILSKEKEMQPAKVYRLWPRIVKIAAAVVLIIFGIYFFNYHPHKAAQTTNLTTQKVVPGTIGATLTLANGKKIRLADVGNGTIAQLAGIDITKTANGELIYEIKNNAGSIQEMNTLTTAKGETYMVILPDKSKVWLNAASSLTYNATNFNQGKRVVELRGEGYFEVAKDRAHPFVVKTTKQEVEVLGTHFNINSYVDEPTTITSLLEGAVKITSGQLKETLRPGEQSILKNGAMQISLADVDADIAWKNGEFIFEGQEFKSLMRTIGRWYDVIVVYDYEPENLHLGGKISKYESIQEVLDLLQGTGDVKFKIEGRRIRVIK